MTHPHSVLIVGVGSIGERHLRCFQATAHRVLEGVTVENTVHVLTRHGNVLGSYSLNQYQSPNESTITVICDRGTVRWESHT